MPTVLAALFLALATPAAAPDPALFDPVTGYRIAYYRGVVGDPPSGVTRIDDRQAAALYDSGKAIFLDVTPAAGGRRDASSGVWHLAEPHVTIAGAHWFPEAGRGPADPAIDGWFAKGVRQLAHGSHRRTIVAFCLADCWMSWNASWKLVRAGYRDVRWYANGADGWRDLGRSLVDVRPEADKH
jgi:PQQ-dependent catabolism-associated CXXCW motif protein